MFPFEVDFYARQERCKDLLREAAAERLFRECQSGRTGQGELPLTLIGWLGSQVVKLGLRSPHS